MCYLAGMDSAFIPASSSPGHGRPFALFSSYTSIALCSRTMLRLASSMALSQKILSRLLKFFLTVLSRLFKVLGMSDSFDYRKAYEQVSRDLKKALADRDALDNKITNMRKTLAAMAASCESEGIEI